MTAIYLMMVVISYLFFVTMGAIATIEDTQQTILKQLREAPVVVLNVKGELDDDTSE